MEFRSVGIIGAGNIGVGAVTDLVMHGIPTVVVDLSQAILDRARDAVLDRMNEERMLYDALEARAMRLLGQGGVVPRLRHRPVERRTG